MGKPCSQVSYTRTASSFWPSEIVTYAGCSWGHVPYITSTYVFDTQSSCTETGHSCLFPIIWGWLTHCGRDKMCFHFGIKHEHSQLWTSLAFKSDLIPWFYIIRFSHCLRTVRFMPLLLTYISHTSIGVMNELKQWDVITHPCHTSNLRLRHGRVITSHKKQRMWLLRHILIPVKPF